MITEKCYSMSIPIKFYFIDQVRTGLITKQRDTYIDLNIMKIMIKKE